MKKLTVILVSVLLLLNMSGCFKVISVLMGNTKDSASSSSPPVLRKYSVTVEDVNAALLGLQLSEMFGSFDNAIGYSYGQGYELVVFTKETPSVLKISIVPNGKEFDDAFTIDGGKRQTLNGLDIQYTVNRKRYEDFYGYKTSAIVECGGDTAYIRYDYTSRSSECELIALIDALFEVRR